MKVDDVTSDTRFSFTAGFLVGASAMARHARDIESMPVDQVTEDHRLDHRSYVVSSIMQAAAAMESEIAEVAMHGPGHHLGSNGVDAGARDYLMPLAEVIDDQNPGIERFALVLHLLRRPPFVRGAQPWQDASLMTRLRNEIVHYKSKWGAEMTQERLFSSLQQLRHPKPPFREEATNFFPHRCLSAACATWATRTSLAFIEAFYGRLQIPSPLAGHRHRVL